MEIVKLIFEIIIILIGLYLIFFKSYFSEKGRNLATKEDIANITSKIETIKSNIQNISSKEQDWFFESKQSLINYYDNYILWTEYSIKKIDVVINNTSHPEKIRMAIDDLNIQHSKVINSLWRLSLYESDEIFIDKINKIYLYTLKLHHLTMNFLIDFEGISIKFEKLIELAKEGHLVQSSLDSLLKERSKTNNEFVDNRNKIEVEVMKLTNKQVKLIKDKIIEKYPAANTTQSTPD